MTQQNNLFGPESNSTMAMKQDTHKVQVVLELDGFYLEVWKDDGRYFKAYLSEPQVVHLMCEAARALSAREEQTKARRNPN